MSLDEASLLSVSSDLTKSAHTERSHAKLHNILGVTEADLRQARNQSISSVATTRIQNNSLSDASTEAERSPQGQQHRSAIGRRKGSSLLMHAQSDHSSNQLRNYRSFTTLHAPNDVHNSFLPRSGQASDPLSLNFPPHKTKSNTAKSAGAASDSFWHFKLFKSASSRSATTRPPRPTRPHTPVSPPESTATTDWRSVVEHLTPKRPKSVKSMGHPSKSREAARFNQPTPVRTPTAAHKAATYNTMSATDPTCVKVNIWKPKAGSKHWFDGLEDSSEDEDFDEPEFQQKLVLGIESDFRNDQIETLSSGRQSHIPIQATGHDISLIAGKASNRVAVLNAKASKSNLLSGLSLKPQSHPIRQHNFSENSVLDLSSDEDELPELEKIESLSSGRGLRDSVGIRDSVGLDSNIDSSDELSTARTINVISRMKPVEVVRIRRPPTIPPATREQSQMLIPKRGSSLPLANRHNCAESKDDSSDLIAAFPPTPVESVAPSLSASIRSSSAFPLTPIGSVTASFNTSIRSSAALSSTGSVESRRLMSVTRQEESLLAAMRLKKAAMQYNNTSQAKRSPSTEVLESRQSPTPSRTPTRFPSVPQLYYGSPPKPGSDLTPRRHPTSYLVEDGTSSLPASASTFAGDKNDFGPGRLSFSSSTQSTHHSVTPSLHSSAADQRQSRDTNFSFPTANERTIANGHRRTLTVNSHVVALDDLDQAPKRDQIPSQEFIDWPYKGWEARLELGLAR